MHRHKYTIAFADKVKGHAKVIIVCLKCGKHKIITEYFGDN